MRKSILHAALFTPRGFQFIDGREVEDWGLPVCFVGEPGVVKTAFIKAYARACGMWMQDMAPSRVGEGMYGVTPYPVTIDGVTYLDFPRPMWTRQEQSNPRGVGFNDECNTVGGVVAAAQLGLFEKVLGTHTFNPLFRVISAMNPVDIAANGHDDSAPIVNRKIIVPWEGATQEEFQSFLMSGCRPSSVQGCDAAKEEERVLNEWPEAYAHSVGLFCAFYGSNPHWLQKYPKDDAVMASKPWASFRSNEAALRCDVARQVHKLDARDADDLLRGATGNAWFEAFDTFREHADLPNSADLLDEKVQWKHTNAKLDRTHAVLASCTALVIDARCPKRKERAQKLWSIVADVGTSAGDIVVPVCDELTRAMLHTSTDAIKVLAKIRPAVDAMKAARAKRGAR